MRWHYAEENRRGDHICYMSDLRKFSSQYPDWRISRSLESIVDELLKTEKTTLEATAT
jgi:CDP-paratose 2-epimerase